MNILKYGLIPALTAALAATSGCSSDSTSSGVPANAIVLSALNSSDTVEEAATLGYIILGLIESASPTCLSGTITPNETVTVLGSVETTSGNVSATDCEVATGSTISGSINYEFTEDSSNGAETTDVTGFFSLTSMGVTATVTALNIKETGNFFSGDYSTNIFSFTADSSIGQGFAVRLDQPLVGNDSAPPCPTSGAILISGGQGTEARATLIGSNLMSIELDDGTGFAEIASSPIPCTDVFF